MLTIQHIRNIIMITIQCIYYDYNTTYYDHNTMYFDHNTTYVDHNTSMGSAVQINMSTLGVQNKRTSNSVIVDR